MVGEAVVASVNTVASKTVEGAETIAATTGVVKRYVCFFHHVQDRRAFGLHLNYLQTFTVDGFTYFMKGFQQYLLLYNT